jgi:hypothetical protein
MVGRRCDGGVRRLVRQPFDTLRVNGLIYYKFNSVSRSIYAGDWPIWPIKKQLKRLNTDQVSRAWQ